MKHLEQPPAPSSLVGTFSERRGRHGLVGFRPLGGAEATRPFTAPAVSGASASHGPASAVRQRRFDPFAGTSSSARAPRREQQQQQRALRFQRGTPYQTQVPTVHGERFAHQAPPASAGYNTSGMIKGILQDAAVARLDAEKVARARSRGRGFAMQHPTHQPRSIFASNNIGDCRTGRQDLGGARERVFNKDYKDHTTLWSAGKGAMVGDKSVAQTSRLAEGELVECRMHREAHKVVVARARLDGTYDVTFDAANADERLAGRTFKNMARAKLRTKESAGSGEIRFCHRWGGKAPKRRHHHTDVSWDAASRWQPAAYHPQKPHMHQSGPEAFARGSGRR
jgi:hypothetical protein